MKGAKYGILLCLSTLRFGCIVADDIQVTNATRQPLFIAFAKTASKGAIKAALGLDKNRYKKLYVDDDGNVSIQLVDRIKGKQEPSADGWLPVGETAFFSAYPREASKYDRTLLIVPAVGRAVSRDLELLGAERIDVPKGITALEVAGDKNVVIVSSSLNTFALKSWTQKLQEEVELLKNAMKLAFKDAGVVWDDFASGASAQWDKVKNSFGKAYNKAKQGASKAKATILGKTYSRPAGISWEKAIELAGQGSSGYEFVQDTSKSAQILGINYESELKPLLVKGDMNGAWNLIQKQFKKTSKQWHPDKNESQEAQSKFQEIGASYEVFRKWMGK